MDPTTLASIGQLGLGGIVFVIWFFDRKEIEGQKNMVRQLMEIVDQLRSERAQLFRMISEQSTIIERTAGILSRVEGRLA